jgi:predicted regulator of Ras-like GTPase activity (Roadblock/LC7/MglB family)
MALYGSLKEMSVADLIQHNCQDRKTALLTVERNGKKAQLYFRDGAVVHATLGPVQGEEAVFQTLTWDDGKFVLEAGTLPPSVSIQRNWSSLLLEGAKRVDETLGDTGPLGGGGRRGKAINDVLISFLTTTKVFRGAIVTDTSGAIRAACIENPNDQDLLGSIAAAILNFGTRTLKLTNNGKFFYSIIQGETGTVVATMVNANSMILALSAAKAGPTTMMEELNRVCENLAEFV